jgi:hypothetical protein
MPLLPQANRRTGAALGAAMLAALVPTGTDAQPRSLAPPLTPAELAALAKAAATPIPHEICQLAVDAFLHFRRTTTVGKNLSPTAALGLRELFTGGGNRLTCTGPRTLPNVNDEDFAGLLTAIDFANRVVSRAETNRLRAIHGPQHPAVDINLSRDFGIIPNRVPTRPPAAVGSREDARPGPRG